MTLEKVLTLSDLYRVFKDERPGDIVIKYHQIREHLKTTNPSQTIEFYDTHALYRTMQFFKSMHYANSKNYYRG